MTALDFNWFQAGQQLERDSNDFSGRVFCSRVRYVNVAVIVEPGPRQVTHCFDSSVCPKRYYQEQACNLAVAKTVKQGLKLIARNRIRSLTLSQIKDHVNQTRYRKTGAVRKYGVVAGRKTRFQLIDHDLHGGDRDIFLRQAEVLLNHFIGRDTWHVIYGQGLGTDYLKPKKKSIKSFRPTEWNRIKVVAKGPRIQTWINGEAVADIVNEEVYKTNARGMIGLQINKVKKGTGPCELAWRNVRISEVNE